MQPIFYLRVKNVPESLYAGGVLPPESSSKIVDFDVLAVCAGKSKKKK
jgi:hypothetical protein